MNYRLFSIGAAWGLCMTQLMSVFSKEENFVLMNGSTHAIIDELGPHVDTRISPCSTFKTTLSLRGYDAGILQDEQSPIWDVQKGYDDYLPSWKGSLTPQAWMQYSCLWYSKLLSLRLGEENIQSYLDAFAYGNRDISEGLVPPGPKNPPWIGSSLTISPKEQVEFIHKMISKQLPISRHALEMTRALVFKEQLPEGWKLFGKTGYSGSYITQDGQILEHGWFVGWLEKEDQFFSFAYLIRDQKIDLDQRIPRAKQLLVESHIMDELLRDDDI